MNDKMTTQPQYARQGLLGAGRRGFLRSGFALGVAFVAAFLIRPAIAEQLSLDENRVALLADLHVTSAAKPTYQREGVARCIQDILASRPRPANVLVYGDLAYNQGETNDYRALKKLFAPLEEAGIRWHACLGNHDRRGPFRNVFNAVKPEDSPVPGHLVSVVKTPHADFILLDSCLEGPVRGGIDEAQRTWLAKTLQNQTKPVFIGAHHPIDETELGPLLASNACCRAYLYGHNHAWRPQTMMGVETLCLPSTGHWGDIGYVMVTLTPEQALFTLHQRDYYAPRPAERPEDVKPEWTQRVRKNDGSQWSVSLRQQSGK